MQQAHPYFADGCCRANGTCCVPYVPTEAGARKFVILSTSGAGSRYLVNILSQFRNIVCHAEAFHPQGVWSKLEKSSWNVRKRDAERPSFMKDLFSYHQNVSVGFKVLPWHLHLDEYRALVSPAYMHVIVLRRASLLKQYVAMRRAELLASPMGKKALVSRIKVDAVEFQKFATDQLNFFDTYLDMVNGKLLEVYYEDLFEHDAAHTMEIIDKVITFLGVRGRRSTYVGLRRFVADIKAAQPPLDLNATMENFHEWKKNIAKMKLSSKQKLPPPPPPVIVTQSAIHNAKPSGSRKKGSSSKSSRKGKKKGPARPFPFGRHSGRSSNRTSTTFDNALEKAFSDD